MAPEVAICVLIPIERFTLAMTVKNSGDIGV
jgi:hypothetical protein